MWLFIASLTITISCLALLWKTAATNRRLQSPVFFISALTVWISVNWGLYHTSPPFPLFEWLSNTILLLALVQIGLQSMIGMSLLTRLLHLIPAATAGIFLVDQIAFRALSLARNDIVQIVAFLGLTLMLQIMMLGEQLYNKRTDRTPQLLLSLALIWVPHFIIFCHLAVGGALHIWHILAQTMAFTLAVPWYYLWAQAHMRGQEHEVKPRVLSRSAAFQGTLLTLVGLYLLMLSGIGVLFHQNQWSNDTASVMLMAAIAPILYMIGHQKTRRHLWVSINKHLTPSQFDYREAWMSLNQQFSPALFGESAVEGGLNAILYAIQYPTGVFCRQRHNRWHIKANNSFFTPTLSGHLHQLLPLLSANSWIIDVGDDNADNSAHPAITTELLQKLKQNGVRWIVPVTLNNELVSCWVVAGTAPPGWPINWETRDFITTLAQQLELYLRAQETTQELNANAQLAAFHQTSAFITHDLKNVLAQLKMLNRNAERHRDNPDFINSILVTNASMEVRMQKMLDQLSKKQSPAGTKVGHAFKIRHWWQAYTTSQTKAESAKHCHFSISDTVLDGSMLNVEMDRLSNVLSHLIDNAIHACKKISTPMINITCECDGEYATIVVHDNGVGMSADLCQRIQSAPFNTTKGNSGIGLGVYDAKTFADKAGGELLVTSQEGHGTTMCLVLPTWRELTNEIADY